MNRRFFYKQRPDILFTGVALRDLNNGKWRVLEAFCFRFNSAITICVPAGYATDLFSVPRPARWLVPKVLKRGNAAAIVHDYMLSELHHTHSREFADKVFITAMKALGIKPVRRFLIGTGVKAYTKWLNLKDTLFARYFR